MKSKQKSLDKYVLYLETLNSSTIDSLDHYVAENVRFKDPFNDVMGSENEELFSFTCLIMLKM